MSVLSSPLLKLKKIASSNQKQVTWQSEALRPGLCQAFMAQADMPQTDTVQPDADLDPFHTVRTCKITVAAQCVGNLPAAT